MKMSICLSVRTYLVHPLGIVIRSQREMGLQQKKLLTITFFCRNEFKGLFYLETSSSSWVAALCVYNHCFQKRRGVPRGYHSCCSTVWAKRKIHHSPMTRGTSASRMDAVSGEHAMGQLPLIPHLCWRCVPQLRLPAASQRPSHASILAFRGSC